MSTPAARDAHEFVVAPELAEVAERLGVPLHAGDRVRLEVIHGGRSDDEGPGGREAWPPAWVGSITTDDENLATRARDVLSSVGRGQSPGTCWVHVDADADHVRLDPAIGIHGYGDDQRVHRCRIRCVALCHEPDIETAGQDLRPTHHPPAHRHIQAPNRIDPAWRQLNRHPVRAAGALLAQAQDRGPGRWTSWVASTSTARSVTIRTEFVKPEKGRYLHPAAPRPLTHAEAALLRTFPLDHQWCGAKVSIARQIGNAVPVRLAHALGRLIARTYE